MLELLSSETAGVAGMAGAGSGIIGVLMAWLGIKSRLDTIEKKVDTVVSERECQARSAALAQRVDNSVSRFNRIDTNIEVLRELILKSRQWNQPR